MHIKPLYLKRARYGRLIKLKLRRLGFMAYVPQLKRKMNQKVEAMTTIENKVKDQNNHVMEESSSA